MDFITKNLEIIARCIQNNEYKEVETDRFELKNLSGGWGEDLYKSVCAFLNTNGGVVVIGINDKNTAKPPHYKFTGYINSSASENHLTQELPKKFTDKDGKPLDLTDYVSKFEIRDFLDGRLAIVYVEGLPADKKYVYYKGGAYIRKLTGDHLLNKEVITEYEEVKKGIIRHQELKIVTDTTLDVISINILNDYIYRFNQGKKRGEAYKKNIEEALPFLQREGFMRDNQPTLLGVLVCGVEPERYIQGKCQADCYVQIPGVSKVAQSKEVIEDNIIELIQRCQNFVWRNIQVGIAYTNGGTADPEYPESLIRESINNAFAHRDYVSDRFIIIEIRPNSSLMIRNPGAFEQRQRIYLDTEQGKIRRIIPLQVARNPKLTHLLKSFDYWEGKGNGLSSLIDSCLENEINVPYYILSTDEIKLFIPKGKVLDEEMQSWLSSFTGYMEGKMGRILSNDEKIMLSFFKKSEDLNALERYTILITADNNHNDIIRALADKKLIFKNPNSPELYPIYQVDRILLQKDFSEGLQFIFDEDFVSLKQDYKEVLNTVYWHEVFGEKNVTLTANSVGHFLYLTKYKIVSDVKDYENFKRKVRNIFNQLEQKKFIVRKDSKTKIEGGKPDFKINENYSLDTTLLK